MHCSVRWSRNVSFLFNKYTSTRASCPYICIKHKDSHAIMSRLPLTKLCLEATRPCNNYTGGTVWLLLHALTTGYKYSTHNFLFYDPLPSIPRRVVPMWTTSLTRWWASCWRVLRGRTKEEWTWSPSTSRCSNGVLYQFTIKSSKQLMCSMRLLVNQLAYTCTCIFA